MAKIVLKSAGDGPGCTMDTGITQWSDVACVFMWRGGMPMKVTSDQLLAVPSPRMCGFIRPWFSSWRMAHAWLRSLIQPSMHRSSVASERLLKPHNHGPYNDWLQPPSAMYGYTSAIVAQPASPPGNIQRSVSYFPSFYFPHSTDGVSPSVWLVTQLYMPAAVTTKIITSASVLAKFENDNRLLCSQKRKW